MPALRFPLSGPLLRLVVAAATGLLVLPAALPAAALDPPALASSPAVPEWEPALRARLETMADELTARLQPWPVPDRIDRIQDYGAVPDGTTVSTAAIQRAIEACAAAGGGVVLVAGGDFVTGTLDLRSGVLLEIAEGSRLLGSTDLADYPERIASRRTVMDTNMGMNQSLLFAEGVERVGIRGRGVIDFRGTQENFPGRQTIGATPGRPFGIRMLDSRWILVEDVTLRDAACWAQNYLNCEDLLFQRITVENHANHNNDGLDLDGCRRVIVRHCTINSEDDAFCLKGASLRPTEDVLVEDCTFVTTCNAFKIGTDTQGDFRRIYGRRLRLGGIPEGMRTWKGRDASTGITLATVDGGAVEDILISGAVIEGARAPVFLRIGSRGRLLPGLPPAPVGPLRRILLEDLTGTGNHRQGSLLAGLADHPIEDVVLRRVDFGMSGGGTAEMAAAPIPENPKGYPDAHQFSPGGLPAHGFTLRHARRITFESVRVTPATPDPRPLFHLAAGTSAITHDGAPLE